MLHSDKNLAKLEFLGCSLLVCGDGDHFHLNNKADALCWKINAFDCQPYLMVTIQRGKCLYRK